MATDCMHSLLAALANPRVSLHTHETLSDPDPPPVGGSFSFMPSSDPLFIWIAGNPLGASWADALERTLARAPAGSTLLCWSGTLADGLFDGDFRNWTRPGKAAFDRWLDATRTRLGSHVGGHRLGIVAHHTHILSDVSSQMRLWHELHEHEIATVLHPAALIAPSMVRDLNDHLTRAISMVGPRCTLCILEDITAAGDRIPWGTGALPHQQVHALLREFLPPSTPLFVSEPPFFR